MGCPFFCKEPYLAGQSQQYGTGKAQWCWFPTRVPGPNRQRRLAAFRMSDKVSSSEPGGPSGVDLPPGYHSRIVSGDSPPLECRTKSAAQNRVGPAVLICHQATIPELSAATRRLQNAGQSQQYGTGKAQWCWFPTRVPGPNRQRRLAAFKMLDKVSSMEPGRPSGVGLPPGFQARTACRGFPA